MPETKSPETQNFSKENKIYLAINSRIDEAWQVLHHVRNVNNPLQVANGAMSYLDEVFSRSLETISRYNDLYGIKRFNALPILSRFGALIFYLLLAYMIIFHFIYFIKKYCAINDRPTLLYLLFSFLYDISGPLLAMSSFVYIITRFVNWLENKKTKDTNGGFLSLVLIRISFLPLDSIGLLSMSILSPVRWISSRFTAMRAVITALPVLILRYEGWKILQKFTMGLDGYILTLPSVEQIPLHLPIGSVKYINIPRKVEERVLAKRSGWINDVFGNISTVLSKLTLSTSDISWLLKEIAENPTLIHGSYYTEQECIEMIADWISKPDDEI